MLTGEICLLYMLITKQMSLILFFALALLFLGVEVLSMSASAMIVTMIVFASGFLFLTASRPRVRLLYIYLAAAGGVILVSIVIGAPDLLFQATGRDASLTGRVPLWLTLLPLAKQKLLLGWGYAGFFLSDERVTQWVWATIQWQAPNAHNGYLDIVLQIGVIGLMLYGWVWYRAIRLALVLLREGRGSLAYAAAVWAALFMLVNVLLNLDEGPLPYQDQFTMLMPVTVLSLELAYQRRQVRARLASRAADGRQGAPAVHVPT
jgi:O-antigen ligase